MRGSIAGTALSLHFVDDDLEARFQEEEGAGSCPPVSSSGADDLAEAAMEELRVDSAPGQD